MKELVNLLFCQDLEDFSQKITEELYSKYQFQSHRTGRKPSLKATNRVENSINLSLKSPNTSESLSENHTQIKTQKREYCTECIKIPPKRPYSERDSSQIDHSVRFLFNSNELIEIKELDQAKTVTKREKRTI